jgi:mRNA interferase RelE/StbE
MPDGCKKLQGPSLPTLYRIRCGYYRVVYTINDHILLILVIEVGHRKEIYL